MRFLKELFVFTVIILCFIALTWGIDSVLKSLLN